MENKGNFKLDTGCLDGLIAQRDSGIVAITRPWCEETNSEMSDKDFREYLKNKRRSGEDEQ